MKNSCSLIDHISYTEYEQCNETTESVPSVRQTRQEVFITSLFRLLELVLPGTESLNDTTIADILAGGPEEMGLNQAKRKHACSTHIFPCVSELC